MTLYNQAKEIAREAFNESGGDMDRAQELLHEMCEGLRTSFAYHDAIQFCANNDTSDGEAWLEDCGGIVQDGDTFGAIACRIAFATIYCAASDALAELAEEAEDASVN